MNPSRTELPTAKPGTADGWLRRRRQAWRGDPLLRHSVTLMANMIVLSGLAFVFWVVAGRLVPAHAVGVVTTSMSSITLISTAGALGLPIALVPFLNRHSGQSRSILCASLAVAGLASLLVAMVAVQTPLRPPYALLGTSSSALAVAVAVVTTLGSVQDAAFIAARRSQLMLIKNSVSGVFRIALLVAWQPWDWPAEEAVHRLMLIQAVGALLPALIAAWQQRHLLRGPLGGGGPALRSLRGFALHNYGAALVGMLPMTVTPLLVISMLGSAQAAYFSMPMMLLGLLNVIPNAVGQSVLAENATATDRGATLRRAARISYTALVPAAVLVMALAHPALSVFGPDYAWHATGLLRWLALGAIFSVLSYLTNAAVNAAGHGRGFLLLSGCNAAIVLSFVWLLGPGLFGLSGLTAVGCAWAMAQATAAVVAGSYLLARRGQVLGVEPRRGDRVVSPGGTAPEPLSLLSYPRDPNPYQELLHSALGAAGVRVGYLPERTPSAALNLLLLPAELLLARLRGVRLWHLHWVFGFAPAWAGSLPGARRACYLWFRAMLGWARLVGLRVVWTAHNHLPHAPVFPDDRRARRVLCARADLVIAHTPAAAAALVSDFGLERDRLVVIPHGPFDLLADRKRPRGEVRDGLGVCEGGLLVGLLGRIEAYKGADTLLAAIARLQRSGRWPERVQVLVAGRCDPELSTELTSIAASLRQVRLDLGELSDAAFADYLGALDLALLPFTRISTSGSALAALGAGVPVAVPEPLLSELPPAAVCRFRDLDDFLVGLADTKPDKLSQMGQAGARWVAAWSWEGVATQTLRAYLHALARRGPLDVPGVVAPHD